MRLYEQCRYTPDLANSRGYPSRQCHIDIGRRRRSPTQLCLLERTFGHCSIWSGASAVSADWGRTMGMICVNEFTAASATDTPRCVASWSHTQQQVIYGAYLLLVLLVFAATWSAFSIRQKKTLRKGEIGFSLSLRRWARTSRAAAIVVSYLHHSQHFGRTWLADTDDSCFAHRRTGRCSWSCRS